MQPTKGLHILDLILFKFAIINNCVNSASFCNSDHYSISFAVQSLSNSSETSTLSKKLFSKTNRDFIQIHLYSHDWISSMNCDEANYYLVDFLSELINVLVPIVLPQDKLHQFPAKKIILFKNLEEAFVKATYSLYCFKLPENLQTELRSFQTRKKPSLLNKKNPKIFYAYCNNSFKPSKHCVPVLKDKTGNSISDAISKAEKFSEYFLSTYCCCAIPLTSTVFLDFFTENLLK